jgi:hypothetical protein
VPTGSAFLLRDRAGQVTGVFDAVFTAAGSEVLKTPPRCPRATAHAERWVRTLRGEVTDRTRILGQRHLRHVPGRVRAARHRVPAAPGREPVTAPPTRRRPRSCRAAADTPQTDPRRTDQRGRTSRIDRHEAAGHRRYEGYESLQAALRAVAALPAGVTPRNTRLHLWLVERPASRAASNEMLLVDADSSWEQASRQIRSAVDAFRFGRPVPTDLTMNARIRDVINLMDDAVDLTPARHCRPAWRIWTRSLICENASSAHCGTCRSVVGARRLLTRWFGLCGGVGVFRCGVCRVEEVCQRC